MSVNEIIKVHGTKKGRGWFAISSLEQLLISHDGSMLGSLYDVYMTILLSTGGPSDFGLLSIHVQIHHGGAASFMLC